MTTPNCFMDYETASECDLKKCGVHKYARHPSTRVLVLRYAIDDGPINEWRPGQPWPQELIDHDDAGGTYSAWNAQFEQQITNWVVAATHLLPRGILSRDHWRCTMVRAAFWGLPMRLEHAAKALGLRVQKDLDGYKLMLKCCKPSNSLKSDYKLGLTVAEWLVDTDPTALPRLSAYCAIDVEVEREITRYLPPLPTVEQAGWVLDMQMNDHGWTVDLDLIGRLKALAADALHDLEEECVNLCGLRPSQGVALLGSINAALALDGFIAMPDMRKDTVAGTIAAIRAFPGTAASNTLQKIVRVLEIRQQTAKSSVSKLDAMERSACSDGAIRGLIQFYGATRTGRWAGRLVQVQNLPRPMRGLDCNHMASRIKTGLIDVETLRDLWGSPLEVIASLLRSCLVSRTKLIAGDLAQIEARVIAWLAGQNDLLNVFASGQDVYVYTANKIGSTDRQLGKVLVLACGFGMGFMKFVDTALGYGLKLTLHQGEELVRAWRDANSKIVGFWWNLDRAVRDVLDGKRKTVNVGPHIMVGMGSGKLRGCLLIRLPSGRPLVYRNARIMTDENGREEICYDGLNQKNNRWETIRTYGGKLAENVTQATARDIAADAIKLAALSGDIVPMASIHDEIVGECSPGLDDATLKTILQSCMTKPPAWAKGLPVGADVKVMERYGK